MNQTLELLLTELEDGFPDTLHVIYHQPTDKYGCYCFNNIYGLACFTDEIGAYRFCEHLDLDGMQVLTVNFDEAREIAKARPMPIVSMMLMDSTSNPKIHYIR